MNWVLFTVMAVIANISFAFIGYLSNDSAKTALDSVKGLFRLLPFTLVVLGNAFWVAAIFYGFLETQFAITAVVAFGVVVSFVFSVFAYGITVTFTHIVGVLCILLGIYLLK